MFKKARSSISQRILRLLSRLASRSKDRVEIGCGHISTLGLLKFSKSFSRLSGLLTIDDWNKVFSLEPAWSYLTRAESAILFQLMAGWLYEVAWTGPTSGSNSCRSW